jgi:hypothetical protein
MADLRRQLVRPQQGMRASPRFALDLTEGLRQPARECEFVKLAEDQAVFLQQLVEW